MIFYKTILFIAILLLLQNSVLAINLSADLFSYDENKIAEEFKELANLEKLLLENANLSHSEIVNHNSGYNKYLYSEIYSPLNITEISAPGKIPSFWWAFSLSIIGSYTLYGAVAGPIAVGVVYLNTHKNKQETKKAIYGCLTGTVLGLGIKYLTTL